MDPQLAKSQAHGGATRKTADERRLADAFSALDKDNNTYITFEELKVQNPAPPALSCTPASAPSAPPLPLWLSLLSRYAGWSPHTECPLRAHLMLSELFCLL
jgi:hypothetical protein